MRLVQKKRCTVQDKAAKKSRENTAGRPLSNSEYAATFGTLMNKKACMQRALHTDKTRKKGTCKLLVKMKRTGTTQGGQAARSARAKSNQRLARHSDGLNAPNTKNIRISKTFMQNTASLLQVKDNEGRYQASTTKPRPQQNCWPMTKTQKTQHDSTQCCRFPNDITASPMVS